MARRSGQWSTAATRKPGSDQMFEEHLRQGSGASKSPKSHQERHPDLVRLNAPGLFTTPDLPRAEAWFRSPARKRVWVYPNTAARSLPTNISKTIAFVQCRGRSSPTRNGTTDHAPRCSIIGPPARCWAGRMNAAASGRETSDTFQRLDDDLLQQRRNFAAPGIINPRQWHVVRHRFGYTPKSRNLRGTVVLSPRAVDAETAARTANGSSRERKRRRAAPIELPPRYRAARQDLSTCRKAA